MTMEPSSAVNSPANRRKLSMKEKDAFDLEPNDIQHEFKRRRLDAVNQSLRKSVIAPSLPAGVGLNAGELAQHLRECIKLSTENKINSKNAFNFLLIDLMVAMTKKSDSEINRNFQMASCTLDASVKIYGYRVDAVHTDTMKMVGNFYRKALEMENADDREDDNEEGQVEKKKGKKRKRKVTLVAPSSLNAKSETEALLDLPPQKTLLVVDDEFSPLMLTRIPKYNDNCLLMVEADVPAWPLKPNEQLVPNFDTGETFDSSEMMDLFRSLPITDETKICSQVSGVVFGADADDETELNLTQSSVFEFDINASVADVAMDDVEPSEDFGRARLLMPQGGYDSGEEIVVAHAPQRTAPTTVRDMKRRLSTHDLEYSMFDQQALKAWCGPSYWKLRPSRPEKIENKENEEVAQRPAKRTRRGRIKEAIEMFDVPEQVVKKHLTQDPKSVLAKSTLLGWKRDSVTLAKDYHHKPEELCTMWLLPFKIYEKNSQDSVLDDPIEDDNHHDEEEEQEEEEAELDYGSAQMANDDAAETEAGGQVQTWSDNNMVAMPTKVGQIQVKTFLTRKYVDVKHLKKCMFTLLTENKSLTFRELVKECPKKLCKNTSTKLTTPMLFNALLHLTNEKNLTLESCGKNLKIHLPV